MYELGRSTEILFSGRAEAGLALAALLTDYADRSDVIVLGLPRGGVPVAHEVARALHAPLDIFLVRKLGVPGHDELAMGAIATGGVRVLNMAVVESLQIPESAIAAVTAREEQELARRDRLYRGDRPPPNVRGRVAILVDDGMATGSTQRAAVAALRPLDPARIVVAVPVAAPSTCHEMHAFVDEVVCVRTPDPFYAIGIWYRDFSQTSDDEIRVLLSQSNDSRVDGGAPSA